MKSGLVKPEDMKGFAERIYNEARRLITLVEDIIKLSKLDEGNVQLEKEEVDLYKLDEGDSDQTFTTGSEAESACRGDGRTGRVCGYPSDPG